MSYSFKTGVWKTFKNGVIMLGPALLAFLANLPLDVQTKYAPLIGLIAYFIKNWYENKDGKK